MSPSPSSRRRLFPKAAWIGRSRAPWALAAALAVALTLPAPAAGSAPAAAGHPPPRLVALDLDGSSASGGTVLARFALEPPAGGLGPKTPVHLDLPVELPSGQRPPRLWWRKGGEGWTSVPSSFDWRTSTLSADLDEATGEISLESGDDVYFHALLEAGEVAQFTGAATWRLPLAVPAGAGGLSIPLTVTYSSDQINAKTDDVATDGSWLGIGFDLDVGRITSQGLAAAGQNSELVAVSAGPETNCSQGGWTCKEKVHQFSTKEAIFWRIEKVNREWERHVCWCPFCIPAQHVRGYIKDDAYWRVWDHDGTRYEFGVGSVGDNRGFVDLPWNTWAGNPWDWTPSSRSYHITDVPGQGDNHKQVVYAQFGLEKVVDVHGNTLEIEWRSKGAKPRPHGCGLGLPEVGFKESYPERIRYTTNPGAGDHHAEYEVVFLTSAKAFDTLEDAGIAQTSRWLDAVEIYFHPVGMAPVLIKKYRFIPYIDHAPKHKAYYLNLIEEYGKNGALLRTIDPRWVFIPKAVKQNQGPGSEKDRWFLDGLADNGYGGSLLFTYQNFDLHRSRRQIAKSVTVDPGLGPAMTTGYAYFDPEVEDHDPDDFETLIGFGRVHQTSPGGVVTRTYFEEIDDNPGHWFRGKVNATEVYDTAGTRRRRTELGWGREPISQWHSFVFQTDKVEKSWGDDGQLFATQELYQYLPEDQNCHHPTHPCGATGAKQWGKRTRTFFYPDVNQPWTHLTLHRYAANEQANLVRRVQAQTLRNGSPWTTLARTDHLYIDGNLNFTGVPNPRGLLRGSRSQVEIGQDLFAYGPRLTHDAFGNVVSSREYSGYSTGAAWPAGGAETTITFDVDHHLFPTRVRNALGHETETRYYFVEGVADGAGNGLPGQPKRVTDANGVHQAFTRFDNHGRLTHRWDNQPEAWFANLAKEVRTYADRSVAGVGGSVTVSNRDDAGTGAATYLWRASFFDGAGRRVQSQREAIGAGKAMVVNVHYDATGALASTTRAHKLSSSGGFLAADYGNTSHPVTYTEYDELRRPARSFGYDGSYVETEYDVGGHRGTRVIDAQRTAFRHVKQDAFGRTVEVVEGPLGGGAPVVTGYGYDDLGNLVEVEDAAGNLFSWTYDALGRTLSEDDPDRGLTLFEYDAAGRETRRTDALGNVISTTYDLLGRKKQQHAGSAGASFALADRTWTYDQGAFGIGRLSHAVSRKPPGQLEHQRSVVYDSRGRTTGVTWTTAGVSRSRSYFYDAADRVSIETDPDGEELWTTYNNAGLPALLTAVPVGGPPWQIDLAVAGFDGEDRMSTITFGNGVSQSFVWFGAEESFRLKRSVVEGASRGSLLDLSHFYDDNGRITRITEQKAPPGVCGFDLCVVAQDFGYDFLGRLTSAATFWTPGAGGVYSRAYAYDAVGNLTTVTRDGVPETYGYDPDHPHAVRWRNGADRYQYDDAGNMTGRLADNGIPYGLAWTPYGQLAQVSGLDGGVTFHWGPDGELVRKYNSLEGTSTIYAGPDYELDGTVRVKYYNFAGKRIAVKRAGTLTYLAGDHLSSTSIATDATGALVSSKRYLPFGGERYSAGTSPTDRLFTGERRHDDAGGLYHMGARFYDPEVLRWTSADTILPDVYSSQQLNRYTYALNNPLSYVDPSGHGIVLPEDAGTPSYGGGGGPPPDPFVIPPLPDDFQPPPPGPPPPPGCGIHCGMGRGDAFETWVQGLALPVWYERTLPRHVRGAKRWRRAMKAQLLPGTGNAGYVFDAYHYGSRLLDQTVDFAQGGMSGDSYYLNYLALVGEAGFDLGVDHFATKAAPATGGWSLSVIFAKEAFAAIDGKQALGVTWGDPSRAFGQLYAIAWGSLTNPEIFSVTMDVLFGGSGGPVHGPPAVVYTGAPPVAAPVAAPPATPVPTSTPSPPAQSMP